jgi:glycosyltransferase involved in cell wall biosynthesis
MDPTIIVVWQSLVVGSYRSFFNSLAKVIASGQIYLFCPQRFKELGFQQVPCAPFEAPFDGSQSRFHAYALPVWFLHTQVVFYRGLCLHLWRIARQQRSSQVVFMSIGEPYAVTTFVQLLFAKLIFGRRLFFCFYALQNIYKDFSWPLRILQAIVFHYTHLALVLGKEHEEVIRRHGFKGRALYFPLWFDRRRFFLGDQLTALLQNIPSADIRLSEETFKVGFVGSTSRAKGVLDLLAVRDQLQRDERSCWSFMVVGAGELAGEIPAHLAIKAGDAPSFYLGPLPMERVADFYRSLDVLVVPSRTMPNWKEQFGRVIIEAWACGCLVIGSDSGEIPYLIDDERYIFAEGDVAMLTAKLRSVYAAWKAASVEERRAAAGSIADKARSRFADDVLARNFLNGLESKENI